MTPASKILARLSRPHWFEIIELIKRSGGLAVGELAEELGMSYMGVKKHCLAMQKLGYLDTWRRPKDVGRPEKLYRLTSRLDPVFAGIGDEVTLAILEAAAEMEVNAAEKLLFSYFRKRTEKYLSELKGDSVQERAENFAAIRTKEGYYSQCDYSEEEGLRINEYHNPLEPLFNKFPTVERMEVQMMGKILAAHVERTVERASGLARYRFDLSPR